MVNRNSWAYSFGRATARLTLIGVGYLVGKRIWKQKPIEKSFPKNKPKPTQKGT